MADTKISALTAIDAVAAGDEFPANDVSAVVTKKVTAAQIAAFAVSDTAYASSWDGVTTVAPSKNAVYDRMQACGHPGFFTGNWYLATANSGEVAAGGTASIDNIYYVPFWLARDVTISDLGARVTTGVASGEIKLAIYAHDMADGLPTGVPLAETAGIVATAAGAVSADITGANVTLTGGRLHWAAFRSNSSTIALQAVLGDAVNFAANMVGHATLGTLTSAAGAVIVIGSSAETYANAWPNADSETISITALTTRNYLMFFKAA